MAAQTVERAVDPPARLAEARQAEDPLPLVDALEEQLHDALERGDYRTADTALRAIQEQRQRAQAHVRHERASRREQEALDEIVGHLAAARAGVLAVQQSLHAAVQAERAARGARRDACAAMGALGEQPRRQGAGRLVIASTVIDRDAVLRGIYHYRATS